MDDGGIGRGMNGWMLYGRIDSWMRMGWIMDHGLILDVVMQHEVVSSLPGTRRYSVIEFITSHWSHFWNIFTSLQRCGRTLGW